MFVLACMIIVFGYDTMYGYLLWLEFLLGQAGLRGLVQLPLLSGVKMTINKTFRGSATVSFLSFPTEYLHYLALMNTDLLLD